MSQSCTICRHPRRIEAEDLLRRRISFGRAAAAVGVGRAALHRHWTRHGPADGLAPKRDKSGTVLPPKPPTETEDHSTHPVRQVRPPAAPGWPSRPAALFPAGMMAFCWCGRCQGRRGHYDAA